MRQIQIILAGACLATGASGHAVPIDPKGKQAPASSPVAQAPIPENALRLSRLVNPQDKILTLGMKGFQAGVDGALKKSPEDAAVYEKNPGLLEAILDAGRPVMHNHLMAVIPAHQRRYAQFYAEKFSPAEVDQLIAFYSSPTGGKVIEAMYAGLNLDKIIEAASVHADQTFTAKQVGEFNQSAAAQLPEKFDADDWKALFAFAATHVHEKLLSVTPELNQLVADVENEPDPSLDADMNKAIEGAVAAYMEKRKGSGAH